MRPRLALLPLAVLSACAPQNKVRVFSEAGYTHPSNLYELRMSSKILGDLLGEDWRLETPVKHWLAKPPPDNVKWTDREQVGFVFVPVEGPSVFCNMPAYDLRFEHRETDAEIWVKSLPLDGGDQDKSPRVLLRRLLDGIPGAGYRTVLLTGATSRTSEHRYSIDTLAEGTVNGPNATAYTATFDIANVDRLRLDPDARDARVQLVLLRHGTRSFSCNNHRDVTLPVAIVIAYANRPEDFIGQKASFDRLVGSLWLDGAAAKLSYSPGAEASSPARPPSPKPVAAPPP